MIIYITNPDLELKKKHVVISCHKLRENVTDGIFNPIKVCMTVTKPNILKNSTSVVILDILYDVS